MENGIHHSKYNPSHSHWIVEEEEGYGAAGPGMTIIIMAGPLALSGNEFSLAGSYGDGVCVNVCVCHGMP